MARNFGSTGASSLLRAATAAMNKADTYNDAIASYNFDLSAKTQDDYKTYQDYLNKRITTTSNSDPSKALSLQRTLTSANRTYNSAEIGRATTNVEFGNISNRDKLSQMNGLYQAAVANGDDNLAQSLFSRMSSLTVTIQNEEQAASNAATAANSKALSAARAGFTAANNAASQIESSLQTALQSGKKVTINGQDYAVTPKFFAEQKGILLATKAKNLQTQIDSGLDTDTGTLKTQLDALRASGDYTKYATPEAFSSIESGLNRQSLQYDPITKSYSVAATPHTLDAQDNPQYNGGRQGNGNYVIQRQYGTDTKGAGSQASYILPGFANKDKNGKPTGEQGYYDPVAGKTVYDLTGQKGPLNYATLDPGQSYQDLANLNAAAGKGPDYAGAIFHNIADNGKNLLNIAGRAVQNAPGFAKGGLSALLNPAQTLSNLFNRNNQAQAQAAQQKALADRVYQMNVAKDAATVAASRQLLPQFKAPAPPPPPKITAKPSQYNLPPLPAPVPLGKTGISTPALTGNKPQDILNLGRSLGGLL